jgi:ABC-type phosphate/phosphonate transport system substrate-binding protein
MPACRRRGTDLRIHWARMLVTRPLRRGLLMIACLVVLLPPLALAADAGGQTAPGYRFGVFPYVPALTIDRIFGPMAASFAAELGRPVHLKTRSTFESFAEQLEQQTYDIIFVHPFLYVEAADRHDYLPLARLEGQLTAVVLVSEERPWGSWSDLAGKVIATPPPLSAVSELARWALLDAGLVPQIDTTLQHYQTKMGCLHAVSVGAADACVLPKFVLPQISEIGEGSLRVMAESSGIPNLVFATHRRLPRTERNKLLALILSWPDTAQGRTILTTGAWPGFVAAQDADYAQVRGARARLRMHAER